MSAPVGSPVHDPTRDGMTRRSLFGSTALVATAFGSGCSDFIPSGAANGDQTDATELQTDERSRTETDTTDEDVSDEERTPDAQIQPAAHEFVPVGATRKLAELGEILEVIEFGGRIEVNDDETQFTCRKSGVVCR